MNQLLLLLQSIFFIVTKQSMWHLIKKVALKLLHIETKGMYLLDLIAYYRDKKQNRKVTAFLLEHGDR